MPCITSTGNSWWFCHHFFIYHNCTNMLSDDTCLLQFVIKYFQTAATTELLYINVEDHPGELIRRVISKTPFGRCHHLCYCPYCRVE